MFMGKQNSTFLKLLYDIIIWNNSHEITRPLLIGIVWKLCWLQVIP